MLHSLSVSPTGDFAATHSLRPGRKEERNKNNLKKRPPPPRIHSNSFFYGKIPLIAGRSYHSTEFIRLFLWTKSPILSGGPKRALSADFPLRGQGGPVLPQKKSPHAEGSFHQTLTEIRLRRRRSRHPDHPPHRPRKPRRHGQVADRSDPHRPPRRPSSNQGSSGQDPRYRRPR